MATRPATAKAPPFPVTHATGAENQSWGHLYDVTFATAPTPDARLAIATAFENAITGKMRLDPEECDEWRWREAAATLCFAEGASIGNFEAASEARAFFADIERAFVAIDKLAKIARVETADDFHGTVDPAFEAARHAARDAIATKASAAVETKQGIQLVLAKTGVPVRPELPAHLAGRFPYVPRARRAQDGAWFLVLPANTGRNERVLLIVEPDGTARTSEPIQYGQFDALAVSPNGASAIVTTNLVQRSTDRLNRALVSEVARASAAVSPVGEVTGVGANQVCELAWTHDDRIVVLTEDRIRLFDRASWKPLAKSNCRAGSEIAATASGRYVLIACAEKKIHARLYETTRDTLRPLADLTERGRPWSDGERLFLSSGRRHWEIQGLERTPRG